MDFSGLINFLEYLLGQIIISLPILPAIPIMFLMWVIIYVIFTIGSAFGLDFEQIEAISAGIRGFFASIIEMFS